VLDVQIDDAPGHSGEIEGMRVHADTNSTHSADRL
jgi:hypothetical protein